MKKVFLGALVFLSFGIHAQTNEIEEVAKKRELATYNIHVAPNPSNDHVVVAAPEGSICTVYSSNGIYVGQWEIREEGLRLDNLGSGVFIAQVQIDGQSVTRRFVIL